MYLVEFYIDYSCDCDIEHDFHIDCDGNWNIKNVDEVVNNNYKLLLDDRLDLCNWLSIGIFNNEEDAIEFVKNAKIEMILKGI